MKWNKKLGSSDGENLTGIMPPFSIKGPGIVEKWEWTGKCSAKKYAYLEYWFTAQDDYDSFTLDESKVNHTETIDEHLTKSLIGPSRLSGNGLV